MISVSNKNHPWNYAFVVPLGYMTCIRKTFQDVHCTVYLHIVPREDQKIQTWFSFRRFVKIYPRKWNVEKIEYFKEEENKKTMKRKIQGFIETLDDLSWTVKNDENLKVLIRNQTFCQSVGFSLIWFPTILLLLYGGNLKDKPRDCGLNWINW